MCEGRIRERGSRSYHVEGPETAPDLCNNGLDKLERDKGS